MRSRALLLSLSLLLLSFYAEASPAWSPEIPVSGPPSLGPAVGLQAQIAAASDGQDFLVAWVRHGAGSQVVAARVSAQGELLDRVPIRIDQDQPLNSDIVVASNGRTYLVAWRSYFASVVGRLLDRSGRPLGPIQYLSANGAGRGPVIASNGDSYLVVSGGMPARATLVSAEGKLTNVVIPEVDRLESTSVASDGHDYMVSLVGAQQNQLFKVTAEGEVRGPVPLRHDYFSQLAWDGTQYLLTSLRSLITLDADGREKSVHSLFVPWYSQLSLRATGIGAAMLLVEEEIHKASPAPVSVIPIVSGVPGASHPTGITAEEVVVAGTGPQLMVWRSGENLYHTLFDVQSGPASAGAPTALSAIEQRRPAVTSVNGGWFVAWRERDHEDRVMIRGSMVSPQLTDQSTFVIAPEARMFFSPDAATGSIGMGYSGKVVLVLWFIKRGAQLVGRRFTPEGQPLDEQPFLVADKTHTWDESEELRRAAVIWNGRYFLVATGGSRIRITRVSESGTVFDPDGISIPESGRGGQIQVYPAIVSTGESSILVFQDGALSFGCQITCPQPPPPARIESLRLDVEGRPMDAKPTVLSNYGTAPRVAWNGSVAVAVWPSIASLQALRLGIDGLPLASGPPIEITSTEHGGTQPHIHGVSNGFFIAWIGRGVQGRFVATSGALDSLIQLGSEPHSETPMVSVSTDGKILVSYSRWSDADGGVFRSFYRGLGVVPPRSRGVRRSIPLE